MPDLVITVTGAEATRMQLAFGTFLNLHPPGPASLPQVKAYLVDRLKEVVQREEVIAHAATRVALPFNPT